MTRTRYYFGTTTAGGAYTFPQPIKLRGVQKVTACRTNLGSWVAITLYWQETNNPQDPESAVVVPQGVQVDLDGRDHDLYGVQLSAGGAQMFSLTFVEDPIPRSAA